MSSGVVFIQLGPAIPAHLVDAITQVARFTSGQIYFVAERAALANFALPHVNGLVPVACEDLGISVIHQTFRDVCPFDKGFRDGFWTHTTERFYYLSTLAERFGLENGVHIESDSMVYADIDLLAPKLGELYSGIAAPFDCDDRAMASFVFWRRPRALEIFCEFIVDHLKRHPDPTINDMTLLSEARHKLGKRYIDSLPILPGFYTGPLCSPRREGTSEPELFFNNVRQIGSVFDTITIGQYLGGIDPRNFIPRERFWYQPPRGPLPPAPGTGSVNETSIFNPSVFEYSWIADAKGRLIPHMGLGNQAIPIVNLHIHSKALGKFASSLGASPRSPIAPPRITADEIITGERLQAIADVAVITEEKRAFHTFLPDMKLALFNPEFVPEEAPLAALRGARVVYVYSEMLGPFLARILPLLPDPIVLVSHTGDDGVDERYREVLEDSKIIHWFAQNVSFRHPKLTALPIGLANAKWPHGDPGALARVASLGIAKRPGLYLNFDTNTNVRLRRPILEALVDKPFAIMGRKRRMLTYFTQTWAFVRGKRYVDRGRPKPYPDYLVEMSGWRYAVSPPGNGIDCHRTWEALYLGVIPVVSPPPGGLLDGLPAIVVEDFATLTLDKLESELDHLNGPFEWEKLTLSYWRDRIRKAAQTISA